MKTKKRFQSLFACLILTVTFAVVDDTAAETADNPLSLKDSIDIALKANLGMKRSREQINAAHANKNRSRTYFLPAFNTTYQVTHRDNELTQNISGTPFDTVVQPQDEYAFITSFTQPIFTGFGLLNQYEIAGLGLDIAEVSAKLTRQDVILDAQNAFYSVLKDQKLMLVRKQTVMQITAQKEVAENMYEVGMSPLNDLLQSQVQLANAKQALVVARNNLEISKTQFNTVMRRPVNTLVFIADELDYKTFSHDIDYCLAAADQNRLEIQVADLEIEIAAKEVKLTEKDFFPAVNVKGTYLKRGDDWDATGGDGISNPETWDVQAVASWDFWQWGRTAYGRKEKLSRLAQSKYRRTELFDNIHLEVKTAYLRTKESEQNIITIEKAIEQAKENLRITEEQYKEQVATNTDVLVAQTLLTETMTNYYSALYNYKIAKAVLLRGIGREVLE